MDIKDDTDTVTKGEFAILIGVSAGRVSQYLKEGRISPAAVHGEGRNARIRVEQAKADLRISLDVGQRFGNGLGTRLDPSASRSAASARAIEPAPISGIDQEIKEQKLEQIRRANRNAAIADAMARGTLMKTDDAKHQMAKIASDLLAQIEGKLPDIATEIATEFKIPQRDVLHTLRASFRQSRAGMAKNMRDAALSTAETVDTVITVDESADATLN